MTDEEKKKADDTAKAEADAKAEEKVKADAEFDVSLDGLTDEEKAKKIADKEASHPDKKTDYKAQAQREREAREKAEKALADKRFKDAERRRKAQEAGEQIEDDEDKPVTGRDLQRILDENTQKTEKRLMGDRIKEFADDLADSPEEAEAIREVHANRTFPSYLSLQEQVQEAHAIVNRARLNSTNSELKRALKSKNTAFNDPSGTHRDPMDSPAPKMAPDMESSLKSGGFTYDSKSKLWKKKLPTGKFLYKDTRTKPVKTWMAQ